MYSAQGSQARNVQKKTPRRPPEGAGAAEMAAGWVVVQREDGRGVMAAMAAVACGGNGGGGAQVAALAKNRFDAF